MSKAVRKYLRDYQGQLKDAWARGVELGLVEQAQAQTLGDIADLEYESMKNFYEEDDGC